MKNKYILNWLQSHFLLQSFRNGEALISCPACGKDKLYFNIDKKIGHCHYASCLNHIVPVTVDKLKSVCGFGPDESYSVNWLPSAKSFSTDPVPVLLPEEAKPILTRKKDSFFTRFPLTLKSIKDRGLSTDQIYHYNLHFDGLRVYIPVYSDGKMVQWVGRASWWFENKEMKYKYAMGAPISSFLFNWDNNKRANKLTLIENTFNAIAMNELFPDIFYSSTFGSNLSDTQCRLIGQGEAKSVVILWDNDALEKAVKGVQKLRRLGVQAGMLSLFLRQPEDYDRKILAARVAEVHDAMRISGRWSYKLTKGGLLDIL